MIDCIDLIEKYSGSIISLLHEETLVPKGSDDAFIQKLVNTFKSNKSFGIEKNLTLR